jgi:hypothetical protein
MNSSRETIRGKSSNKKMFTTNVQHIPKSREGTTINCVFNTIRGFLLGFIIFRGEKIEDNYIRNRRLRMCMTMKRKTWMTSFLFKEFSSLFIRLVFKSISQNNKHLLILYGHGSHVILKSIK